MADSKVMRFTDPQEYQAAVRAGEVEVTVTSKGEYNAKLTRIDFSRLWMQRSRESLPRIMHSAVAGDRNPIFFLGADDHPPIRHSGADVSISDIVVYGRRAEHYHHGSTGSHWAAMSLAGEDFGSCARAFTGLDLCVPSTNRIIRPAAHLMRKLSGLHRRVCTIVESDPQVLSYPEIAKAMETSLIGAMMSCLASDDKIKSERVRVPSVTLMRRLEELLERHRGRPLYVLELCEQLGISDRTLRIHCQEHLSMSPHRYLWLRRMNLARHALLGASPQTATVTSIAMDFGFAELGRFAVQYRQQFGEPPSATLRRRRVDDSASRTKADFRDFSVFA